MSRIIEALVDRGLEVDELINALTAEKKIIETELKLRAAEGEQIDLADAEREGKQFLARGSSGVIVPVVFTADLLIQSFAPNSKSYDHIFGAAKRDMQKFENFYQFLPIYKSRFDNGKIFRRKAAEVFGEAAPKFISACVRRTKEGTPVSQTRVEWDRAKSLITNSEETK